MFELIQLVLSVSNLYSVEEIVERKGFRDQIFRSGKAGFWKCSRGGMSRRRGHGQSRGSVGAGTDFPPVGKCPPAEPVCPNRSGLFCYTGSQSAWLQFVGHFSPLCSIYPFLLFWFPIWPTLQSHITALQSFSALQFTWHCLKCLLHFS